MRRETGAIPIGVIVYGGIALALIIFGGWFTYRWMADKLHTAERAVNDAKAETVSAKALTSLYKDDLDEANAAVAEKSRRLRAAQASATNYKNQRDALARSTPDVEAYLATLRPESLRKLRRLNAGCSADLSLQCAGKLDGGNASPPDAGSDERGIRGRNESPEGRTVTSERR